MVDDLSRSGYAVPHAMDATMVVSLHSCEADGHPLAAACPLSGVREGSYGCGPIALVQDGNGYPMGQGLEGGSKAL